MGVGIVNLPAELHDRILFQAGWNEDGYYEHRARMTTAAAMARTCLGLHETALDVVWRLIPHPAVIFYLLPHGLGKIDERWEGGRFASFTMVSSCPID